jgi:hypothetical protein
MNVKVHVKTSLTDPLLIESVTPPGTNAAIGMTLCPGRKGFSQAGGRWERDLALDLEAVRAWRPDLVVALLEDHEYAPLGIASFRDDVLAAGLPWAFAPIPDGGVPGREFDAAWRTLGPRVRDILRADGRVLIHCRAGLGRTGMLAAALLAASGLEPEAAIDAVREKQPSRIETSAQEFFVREGRLRWET